MAPRCQSCGRMTNTAGSDYHLSRKQDGTPKEYGVVTICYIAWDGVNGKWIDGCAYDTITDPRQKKKFDKLIRPEESSDGKV